MFDVLKRDVKATNRGSDSAGRRSYDPMKLKKAEEQWVSLWHNILTVVETKRDRKSSNLKAGMPQLIGIIGQISPSHVRVQSTIKKSSSSRVLGLMFAAVLDIPPREI